MTKVTQQVDQILNLMKTKIPTSFPKPVWLPKETSLPPHYPKYPHFTISFNKTPLAYQTFAKAIFIINDIIGVEMNQKHIHYIQMKGKHIEVYLKENQSTEETPLSSLSLPLLISY
jgi:hypothetical protein